MFPVQEGIKRGGKSKEQEHKMTQNKIWKAIVLIVGLMLIAYDLTGVFGITLSKQSGNAMFLIRTIFITVVLCKAAGRK